MMTLGQVCSLLGLMEPSLLGGTLQRFPGPSGPGAERDRGQESMTAAWRRQPKDVTDASRRAAHIDPAFNYRAFNLNRTGRKFKDLEILDVKGPFASAQRSEEAAGELKANGGASRDGGERDLDWRKTAFHIMRNEAGWRRGSAPLPVTPELSWPRTNALLR